MKSEIFNGSRFWNYFKYDFRQMWRNHVKAAIGIGLSGLILYGLWILIGMLANGHWQTPQLSMRISVFTLAFTALELYQTRTYGFLTERRKGSAWLLLPASGFEKWLSMLLMTLIIIPAFFFIAALGIDALLSVVDPTFGKPIVTGFSEGVRSLSSQVVELNSTYETSWSPSVFVGPLLAGFCVNFLFFLLCGITFKRYKILWGFVCIFLAVIAVILITLLLYQTGLISSTSIQIDESDLAHAESQIRLFMRWQSIVSWGVAALLAFLIYRRIKTLKH